MTRASKTAGVLLTGGRSSRLGFDKASLPTPDGSTLAVRTARLLRAVTEPTVEVGPRLTDLPHVVEDDRRGPLGAIVVGVQALNIRAGSGPVLVVATDLPRLTTGVLQMLAEFPGEGSVVPSVDGVPQVLCARYSAPFLMAAADAFAAGQRSLSRLVAQGDVELLTEARWHAAGGAALFADVDTAEDLRRMISDGALAPPP